MPLFVAMCGLFWEICVASLRLACFPFDTHSEIHQHTRQLVARKICGVERMPFISVDMVLEGGSIHVDGEG